MITNYLGQSCAYACEIYLAVTSLQRYKAIFCFTAHTFMAWLSLTALINRIYSKSVSAALS